MSVRHLAGTFLLAAIGGAGIVFALLIAIIHGLPLITAALDFLTGA